MIPKMVDVLVHIEEELDLRARDDLDDTMRGLKGVFSVRIPANKPHLMLVEYNPDWTSSRDILGSVAHKGLHAELVGL